MRLITSIALIITQITLATSVQDLEQQAIIIRDTLVKPLFSPVYEAAPTGYPLPKINHRLERYYELKNGKYVRYKGSTGSRNNTLLALQEAAQYYEAIRKSTEDISQIAANTGVPEAVIALIKQYVFFDEHIIDNRISRFDPDIESVATWDRLSRGDYIKTDITWLMHEYAEALLMQQATNNRYTPAHDIIKRPDFFYWNGAEYKE